MNREVEYRRLLEKTQERIEPIDTLLVALQQMAGRLEVWELRTRAPQRGWQGDGSSRRPAERFVQEQTCRSTPKEAEPAAFIVYAFTEALNALSGRRLVQQW